MFMSPCQIYELMVMSYVTIILDLMYLVIKVRLRWFWADLVNWNISAIYKGK